MKILFVHPAAQVSISDVSRGYRYALERAGHEVADYNLRTRIDYHYKALPEGVRDSTEVLCRQASETILNEALYHEVDLVLVISGLNVHPIFLWLLSKVNIPAAVVLTESPYDDEQQSQWVDLTKHNETALLTVFTNDAYSANRFGWHFLPPSFDPAVHKPAEPNPEELCDVLMIGTGWSDRQAFLEAVDWSGIDLRLYGVWPGLRDNPSSPLYNYFRPFVVDNQHIAEMYCSAKICLNFHRRSSVAVTPGPRVFEVAACKAFQLSDPRAGISEYFGDSVPVFDSPENLGELVRRYLLNDAQRNLAAVRSYEMVTSNGHTFDNRVASMMAALQGV